MTGRWLLVAALLIETPALASPAIDLPAGPLGRSIEALARQSNISVAIADGVAWGVPVKAVRGRFSPAAALRRLVAGTGARVVAIDKVTFRIEALPGSKPVVRPIPPPPAAVQPVDDDQPIIVTASKRDVRFGDYQGIVQRIDGDSLDFGGQQGTDGLVSRFASLSSTHLGAGRNKLFIRGVADSSFTGPTQATVGQYFGDIRLTYNAPDPNLRLYDIAAVEVLEGPQATLYGAGSLGGIVRIVRNPPRLGAAGAAISGGVSLTQHGDPGLDVGGSVNLPVLDDRIALRAVAYGITEGGYIDDPGRGRDDINRTRVVGGRAVLRFDAGDGWSVDVGGTLQHIRGDDSQYADRDAPPLTQRSAFAQGFSADYRLAELVVGKDWDGLRLLSSTGVARQLLSERYDAGASRVFTQVNRTLLISNETRLWRPMNDRFGWVVGASLVHNRARQARALGPVDAPVPSTGVTNRILESTAFGEASVMPIAGLTLTAGGRLTHARLSGDGEDAAPAFSAATAAARARIVADRSETRFLPSVAASALVLPDTILFARYNQGFRPGGLSVDNDFVERFRSDRVATLESGVRYGQPGRGAFDLAASAAWTHWSDIQADFIDGAGLPATSNIGDGRIYSLAVTGGWRPTRELAFEAALVFNDSRVTDPSTSALTRPAIPLRRIPNVARWTGRLGAEYRIDLNANLEFRIGTSARYTGRSRLGVGPMLGDPQGDYLDTSLTARLGRERLGVTLSLTNLADSIGNRFALGTPFAFDREQITPLRPRTLRLGVDAHF